MNSERKGRNGSSRGLIELRPFSPGKNAKVTFTLVHATKAQRGSRLQLYCFFNLGARWGWVVNAKPRLLYSWERPGAHCIRGLVSPRAALDAYGKSRFRGDSIPEPSSP